MELWHWLFIALFLVAVLVLIVRQERILRRSQNELLFVQLLPRTLRSTSEEVYSSDLGAAEDIWSLSKGLVDIGWLGARFQELHYPKLWPLGILLECPVSILRGEELDSLSTDKNFRQGLHESISDLQEYLAEGSPEKVYKTTSEYCHHVVTRGRKVKNTVESEWLVEFIKTLDTVAKALESGDVPEARREMRVWYKSWRGSSEGVTICRVLPKEMMAQAILTVKAILAIYGDTLDWLDAQYARQLSDRVREFVIEVKKNMEDFHKGIKIRHVPVFQEFSLSEVIPTRVI